MKLWLAEPGEVCIDMHELQCCMMQFKTFFAGFTHSRVFQQAVQRMPDQAQHKWLRAHAASERLSRHLGSLSQRYTEALQPTADILGSALGLPDQATNMFAEEVIRGTAAAPLAQLLAVLNPLLRELAGLPSWQIISPGHGEFNLFSFGAVTLAGCAWL